ncbi:ATP-binding protein [Alterinioella nitratireducens]|uniref:ATP-binding protein n=1 Tax=Alterinioella nitratireducens TaxID=2735915 RepID=UPI000C439544|nr:two-component sensor histidine kinase [Dinoroseobacter sp.]MAX72746.1 two-component sensor histidine kinase [Nioella sp.]|tara:strand:+ start:169 stop:1488 length:1320 start_codon:yes stop_codon:yes gene_type:complete
MGWDLIKQALPRGLYGRAALILIVPIVTLQLVVSVGFLQRHFEGVTGQLTSALGHDLRLVGDTLSEAGPQAAADIAGRLDMGVIAREAPDWAGETQARRRWYDYSGREVIATLNAMEPDIGWIDLAANDRRVFLSLEGPDAPLVLEIDRRRVSASNPHQLFVLMIFTGILMTAVAYLFLRNQLRPIRRLARAAEAFGKGRMEPYKPAGALEVRAAGRAFLDMRARIERAIEQRTMMLSGVSHDLRTPLTRMKLALSMLEDAPEAADLMRDVTEMEALLTTFLDFARSDALDDPEPVDLLALAREAGGDAARLGRGQVALVLPEKAPVVALRPQAVRRALGNLLSNALRYGTQARLSLAIMDRSVRFTIEDDGPGIAPEDRAEAVRPFARLDQARNQDRGSGVGLGLAIANDIARGHGGTMRLSDSEDLGGLRVDLVLAR